MISLNVGNSAALVMETGTVFSRQSSDKERGNVSKKKLLFIIPSVMGWFIISPYIVVFPKKHDPQGNWAHDLGVINSFG